MTQQKIVRDLIIITLVFLIFGTALGVIMLVRNINHVPPRPAEIVSPQQNAFTFTTSTITEASVAGHYEIAVAYPQFTPALPQSAMDGVNQLIVARVNEVVTQFKKNYTFDPQSGMSITDTPSSTLAFDFEMVTLNPHLISVKFTDTEYGNGEAHPNTTLTAFNYNRDTDQEIMLDSLFSSPDAYSRLTDYATTVLQAHLGSDMQVAHAQINSISPAFVIAPNGSLVFLFNAYDVASYADGAQEVAVPFDSLRDVLSPTGQKISDNAR